MKSCHIFKKDKNGRFIFDFFWIRSVQNGSNLIKLDQIGYLTNQKMLLLKIVTFTEISVQNGSDLSKMDQN